ncbi:MAG: hypothetical protein HYX20_02650 [Candidatus Yanofskybacteria bacterium]|nr:hypothetical protein [Candidatus Yanofskybacteria bacterium]
MNFKKIWNFLDKPWPHRTFWITIFVILPSLYLFSGMSLVSRPSFLLYQNYQLEYHVKNIMKLESLPREPYPRVYILPRAVRTFFFLPYSFTHRRIGRNRYFNQVYQSYPVIEDDSIVMQEEEAANLEILAHEIGHFIDYYSDPEVFFKKDFEAAENFSLRFQFAVARKLEKCEEKPKVLH